MQERLIELNTAVLAKEKRFDWKCRGYYSSLHNTVMTNGTLHGTIDHNNPYYDKFAGNPYYSAPTQSYLQKWLRETKLYHVEAVYNIYHKWYQSVIYDLRNNKCLGDVFGEKSTTYEKALEIGLLEALKLIK